MWLIYSKTGQPVQLYTVEYYFEYWYKTKKNSCFVSKSHRRMIPFGIDYLAALLRICIPCILPNPSQSINTNLLRIDTSQKAEAVNKQFGQTNCNYYAQQPGAWPEIRYGGLF